MAAGERNAPKPSEYADRKLILSRWLEKHRRSKRILVCEYQAEKMIGVIANDSEHAAIAEFFELFKTPWEFYLDEQTYDVVLCTLDKNISPCATKLTMFYAAHGLPIDCAENIDLSPRDANRILLYKGSRIPIYGGSVTFREERAVLEADDDPRQSGMYVRHSKGRTVVRVGYDLFAEVTTLLTRGQPLDYADIPTLEMHINCHR